MTTEVTGEMPDFLRRAAALPAADPPAREPRQRRTNRRAAASETPPEKPARKPRAAKKEVKERAAPETIKVTLKEFATMRVGEDNAKAFVKVHGLLSELSKGARGKVLAELQKVLG
jgi:hypothetical protein